MILLQQKKSLEYANSLIPMMSTFVGSVQALGVKSCHFLRVFNEGNYFHFSNSSELNYFYISEIKDTGKKFKESMYHKPKMYLWPTKDSDPLICHVSQMGFAYGLTFYEYGSGYFDAVSFSTTKDNENIINHYLLNLNQLSILASSIIKTVNPFTKNLLNSSQYEAWSSIDYSSGVEKINQIYPKIYSKKGEIAFTKREWDCFHLLGKGYRTKQIASELGVSSRTVETYLNRMKFKSGEHYLSGLIELYH